MNYVREREKYEKRKFYYSEENNSYNVIVYNFIVRTEDAYTG